jgi:hypothetical protein
MVNVLDDVDLDLDDAESETLAVAVVDDEAAARAFVRSTIGTDKHIEYEDFEDPDSFLKSDIEKFHIFVVDKVFSGDTRVQELTRKIRTESNAEIIVLSNDPNSDIFDERAIRLLKGRVYLGPSDLRTAVLSILHRRGDEFKSAVRAIQSLDANDRNGQQTINEIRLENIAFPLRRATSVVWTGTEYSIVGLVEFICGQGETASSAMKDFVRKFHEVFSRLNRLLNRGEKLLQGDKEIWLAIKKIVDIEQYERQRTIIVPNEIGQVEFTDKKGLVIIHWYTRGTSDTLEVERVPTLALLKNRDWISAIVRRRTDETLDSVLHTHWIEPPHFSAEEINQFWNN